MSGGKNQTVTQKADPWAATQGPLKSAISAGEGMFNSGGFAPSVYEGQRVAGFGDTSNLGMDMTMNAAMNPSATSSAQSQLIRMMNPDYTSERLNAVKENALDSAIPAATSAFSGSGMLNSSMAMDTVGRAAAEAVAPYEYGAFENAQNRALSAAQSAPAIDRGTYLPGAMVTGVGGAQDAMRQAEIDAAMKQFYEGANPELQNLQGFSNFLLPISGQGGTTSSTQPGAGTLATLGGAGLTGLGTYGALAMNPVTAPFALAGGIGAGLMGLL